MKSSSIDYAFWPKRSNLYYQTAPVRNSNHIPKVLLLHNPAQDLHMPLRGVGLVAIAITIVYDDKDNDYQIH